MWTSLSLRSRKAYVSRYSGEESCVMKRSVDAYILLREARLVYHAMSADWSSTRCQISSDRLCSSSKAPGIFDGSDITARASCH